MSDADTRFTEADLEPSPAERSAARRALAERIAAAVAALAAGAWIGGMVALGAFAAPSVFNLTPAPFSGNAMGAAFARFDRFALSAAVVILAGEVVRTWAAGRRGRSIAARVRRGLAVVMAVAAAYVGLNITPQINELHGAGVARGAGPEGERLERIHATAERIGKFEVAGGIGLVVLHVLTIAARRPEDDDDDEAAAPLPPGPRE